MSEAGTPAAPLPPSMDELRESIRGLTAEGEKLQARAQQGPPSIRELMGLAPAPRVTITRDGRGLIDGVEFEHVDGRRAEPDLVLQELSLALFEGQAPVFALPALAAAASGAVAELTAALERGEIPEPTLVSNDLKTVTVGAVYGDIVSIDCSRPFLLAATDETLAAEIVVVARAAALQTDAFGKYSEGAEA